MSYPDEGRGGGESSLSLDKEFLNSLKGRILLTELGLCFVVFICFAASLSAYLAAALLELLITLVFLALLSSRYHLRLTAINWPCTDFLRCVSATLIFLVVSIVAAARSAGDGGAITAAHLSGRGNRAGDRDRNRC
ncbi:CKLF-like MARVEL transmembrane domain-containing protein 5 isoform X2 [Ascaphus truei]|uniref:CKLF-like MARVEL transmembrane domain-containing protein 5 isoform X2 n=1 Tax=Ascaphus truei TaxID=8439 RepID=UPI003F5A692C